MSLLARSASGPRPRFGAYINETLWHLCYTICDSLCYTNSARRIMDVDARLRALIFLIFRKHVAGVVGTKSNFSQTPDFP
jgi:hypothetical protein